MPFDEPEEIQKDPSQTVNPDPPKKPYPQAEEASQFFSLINGPEEIKAMPCKAVIPGPPKKQPKANPVRDIIANKLKREVPAPRKKIQSVAMD